MITELKWSVIALDRIMNNSHIIYEIQVIQGTGAQANWSRLIYEKITSQSSVIGQYIFNKDEGETN